MYIVNLTTACSHSPSFSSLEAINLNIAKSLNVNACNKKCSRHTHTKMYGHLLQKGRRGFLEKSQLKIIFYYLVLVALIDL